MKEIYADFNDIYSDGTLPLTCAGSVESIESFGDTLVNGEEVWLSDGELRVKGRVFRSSVRCWVAQSDWSFETI